MDNLIYCGKCKTNTPTLNFNVVDYNINRDKKSGEKSITTRKIIKGTCEVCKSKKHIFANNEGKIKERNIVEEAL